MPNTLSYTDPYQVRRGRAPGPLFGKNLNLKKIRLFQISGKNRKHLDRSLEAVKKIRAYIEKVPPGRRGQSALALGSAGGAGDGTSATKIFGFKPRPLHYLRSWVQSPEETSHAFDPETPLMAQ